MPDKRIGNNKWEHLLKGEQYTARCLKHADLSMLVHRYNHCTISNQLFSLSGVDKHELTTVEECKFDTKRNVNDAQRQRVSEHTNMTHTDFSIPTMAAKSIYVCL